MQYTKTIKVVLYWLVIVYLVSSITAVRAGSLFQPRTPGKNDGPFASLIGRSWGASGRSGNALKRSGEQNPPQPETASVDPCPSRIETVSPPPSERALCPWEFERNSTQDREPADFMYAKATTENHFCLHLNGTPNYDGTCVFVYYNQHVQRKENNHWKNCTEDIPVARVCVRPRH